MLNAVWIKSGHDYSVQKGISYRPAFNRAHVGDGHTDTHTHTEKTNDDSQNHSLENDVVFRAGVTHPLKNPSRQEHEEYLPCDKEPSNPTEVWRGSHIRLNVRHGVAAAGRLC